MGKDLQPHCSCYESKNLIQAHHNDSMNIRCAQINYSIRYILKKSREVSSGTSKVLEDHGEQLQMMIEVFFTVVKKTSAEH